MRNYHLPNFRRGLSTRQRRCFFLFLALTFLLGFSPSSANAGPTSSHYELKDYGFGAGGGSDLSSGSYNLFGTVGEVESQQLSSGSFKAGSGLVYTLQVNVPPAPSFTNPASYYNKLSLTLNTGNNPSTAEFAIAISTDNFVSDTNHFVQANDSIGTTKIWQTNTLWGSSGFTIVGLIPGVTYTVKVAARSGDFTESAFGPTAQATTTNPTFSFSLRTTSQASPPFSIDIGSLTAGTPITATDKVTVDISTNGVNGGSVYVYDNNSGLKSTSAGSYTINSVTSDLTSVNEGYGLRGTSVSQTSGGPMVISSPYDGTGNNVGQVNTTQQEIFTSSNAPISGGQGTFEIQAKSKNTTPAANDYSDTLTIIASGMY